MLEQSISRKYEEATRHYYGADTDPFKLVPVVKNREIAHEIALSVDKQLEKISEADLAQTALRAQARGKISHGETDLTILTEEALKERLNMIAVNAELTHARLAPEDFNEDAAQSLAYEMTNSYITLRPVNPDDLRQ